MRALSPGERGVLVAVVMAVAGVLRVGFVRETIIPDPIRADAAHYVQYAHNLCTHGVYSFGYGEALQPDSFRSPGYPLFLALCRSLFGEGNFYGGVRMTQALLDTASVGLAFALARRALPFAGALVVAVLTALSPHLVANTGYLLTETLTTFLLLAALLALHGIAIGKGRGVIAGVLCAALSLCNEALAPLLFAVALVLWGGGVGGRRSARALAWALGLCLVAQGAWAARNVISLAPDAPRGSSRALQTISHGTYPGLETRDPRLRCMPYREDPEQPRFGADLGHFVQVLAARVRERPLRYASWYALEKPFYLWGFDGLQASRDIYTYEPAQSLYDDNAVAGVTLSLMRVLHWPLVALGLLGACMALRRRGTSDTSARLMLRVLAVCLAYGTLLGVVFAPWPRYVLPLRPALFTVAMFAAVAIYRRMRSRAHTLADTPLAAGAMP